MFISEVDVVIRNVVKIDETSSALCKKEEEKWDGMKDRIQETTFVKMNSNLFEMVSVISRK